MVVILSHFAPSRLRALDALCVDDLFLHRLRTERVTWSQIDGSHSLWWTTMAIYSHFVTSGFQESWIFYTLNPLIHESLKEIMANNCVNFTISNGLEWSHFLWTDLQSRWTSGSVTSESLLPSQMETSEHVKSEGLQGVTSLHLIDI